MIHDLKPYPAYADSGAPWLGEVPEHWEIRRTKTVLKERSQKGFPDEPLLAATQTKGVVRKDQYENRTVLALKDLHLLKLVCVGDFVISLRSFQGGIEYAREQGIISPAYTILYPKNPSFQSYLALLFKSKPYIENLSLFVTGIREGQNIDYQKLSRSEIPLPPFEEQEAIVRYLDYMDRRIHRYIHAKQKLIKLLEEQKQAIIHRAVTRGLDPDVRLKDSGVEWLGEVPEHWTLLRLKDTVFQIVDTEHKTAPFYEDGKYLVARTSNIKNGKLVLNDAKYTDELGFKEWTRRGVPEPGDILFTREAPAGEACLVPEDMPLCLGQRVVLFRVNPEIMDSHFALNSLYGGAAAEFINQLSLGSTVPHFNMFDIACIPILLPPLQEQKNISNFLVSKIEELNLIVEKSQNEIALIKEYRTRLISDVVTGKLDVQEAAAGLPLEKEDEETFEDEEDTLEEIEGESEGIIGED